MKNRLATGLHYPGLAVSLWTMVWLGVMCVLIFKSCEG